MEIPGLKDRQHQLPLHARKNKLGFREGSGEGFREPLPLPKILPHKSSPQMHLGGKIKNNLATLGAPNCPVPSPTRCNVLHQHLPTLFRGQHSLLSLASCSQGEQPRGDISQR